MNRILRCAIGLIITLLWAAPVAAQPAPSCTIAATPVAFGSYDVFAVSPLDSTGTVTIRCNAHAENITVTLDCGIGGTCNPRTLLKGTEVLAYNLYVDAVRVTIWGDGTAGTSYYSTADPRNNQDIPLTVFGRVSAGQDVSAGVYTDNVVATINF